MYLSWPGKARACWGDANLPQWIFATSIYKNPIWYIPMNSSIQNMTLYHLMPPLSSEITFFGGKISWNILLYPHYPLKKNAIWAGNLKKNIVIHSAKSRACGTSDHRPTKAVQQYCSVAAIAWFLKISTSVVEVPKDTNRFGGTWGKHTEKCGKPMVSLKESAKGRFSTSIFSLQKRKLSVPNLFNHDWNQMGSADAVIWDTNFIETWKKQLPCQICQRR